MTRPPRPRVAVGSGSSRGYDLTGAPPSWGERDAAHWATCVQRACRDAASWTTPHPKGLDRLRAAVAEVLELDASRLTVTSGTRAAVRQLVDRASRLYLEHPTFADVATLARVAGVPVSTADTGELLSGEVRDREGVLWLSSPARNPDGRTLTEAEVARLDRACGSFRRVVVNETYRWSRPDAARPSAAVLVGSFSKVLGGGAKVGWRWDPATSPRPGPPPEGGPPRPWQLALALFIEEGGLRRVVRDGVGHASRLCRRFLDEFRARPGGVCGVPADHAGYHLLLTWPAGPATGELVGRFAVAGLRVLPGAAFEAGPRSVRISFNRLSTGDYPVVRERLWRVLESLETGEGQR